MNREELETAFMHRRELEFKNILEDQTPSEVEKIRAKYTIELHGRELTGITYDECMLLHNQLAEQVEDCGPLDPAFEYLTGQKNLMLKYAEALNVLNDLKRTDHMLPVHALVSIGSTTFESSFWIHRLYYRASDRQKLITSHIAGRFRERCLGLKIDFVEL